jgi:Uma2 family endonuclease
MSLAQERTYTYADYVKWDDQTRYELIDGVAYAMASPSRLHQKISIEISRQLSNFLRGKPCEVYNAPFDVRLNANSFDDIVVQPDILVVCDESKLDAGSVKGAPDMIIEILSPSNRRHDTVTKLRLYQQTGVREYWMVDPDFQTVQVYILENDKYIVSTYSGDDIVPVHVLEGCEINLADVFHDTFQLPDSAELIKQKMIDAMKAIGISNEQIDEILKRIK